MIEQTPEKDIKQKQNNHNDEEIEIDLIGILRKIIGIRKTIDVYKRQLMEGGTL